MTESWDDGATMGSVATLVRDHRGRADLPDLHVHPDDEMWAWSQSSCSSPGIGRFAYFRSGLAIADMVGDLARWWCPDGPSSVLDFACGYGRSLRYTIQDFGPDHVWGSEILPGAVSFVGDQLGAHAIESSEVPEELDLGRRFDLIFVSSLFSHLPESTFARWLRRLHQHLEPGGLLAISVHDEFLLPAGAAMPGSGIYFQATTEVESLDPEQYGATVVNEDFVARSIAEATGAAAYRRLPTALCFEQDLYLVPADPHADLATFTFRRGAQGCVDVCDLRDDVLTVAGWVATQDDGVAIDQVELRIDGEAVGRVAPALDRPDVASALQHRNEPATRRSGFSMSIERADLSPSQVVTVTAVSSEGRHDVVWSTELREICAQMRPAPAGPASPAVATSTVARAREILRTRGVSGLAAAGARRATALVRPSR